MDTTPISSQPSVDDLLGRLDDEHRRLSALRRGIIHGVPRPALLIRLLLIVSVLLITVITLLITVVGRRTIDLAAAIRLQRSEAKAAERAIPDGTALRDPAVLAAALRRHPTAAARIHGARAAALLAAGDAAGALAAFAIAREHTVAPLPPAIQGQELVALVAVGRRNDARERLLALDLADWPREDRARVLALLPELFADPAAAPREAPPRAPAGDIHVIEK